METHRVLSLATAEEAGETLRMLAHEGDFILIKGSRRLQLERMLEEFKRDVAALP
jgi:UDP-N-acetylmuramyl pentapeptide synthase